MVGWRCKERPAGSGQAALAASRRGTESASGISASRLGWWVSLDVLVVVGLAGSVFAAARVFCWFSAYDDEGYMLMAVQRLLDGQSLYGDLKTTYGPLYYVYRWLVFGLGHVPLTHDAVRTLTVVTWLATAALLALAVWRAMPACRNRLWLTATCAAAAILHLETLKCEPGHPQELVVFGVAAVLAAGAILGDGRGAILGVLLGVISAGLCLTKINVGIFLSGACLLTLAAHTPRGTVWSVLRTLIAVGTLALPCLLLRKELTTTWGASFCGCVTGALALCIVLSFRDFSPKTVGMRAGVGYFLGGSLVTSLLIIFVWIRGGTVAGMITCLVVNAARGSQVFCMPLLIGWGAVIGLVAATVLAARCSSRTGQRLNVLNGQLVAWLKLGFALFTLGLAANDPMRLIQYGPAWTWLVLLIPIHRQGSSGELFFRRLLAFVAILQVLQVYPIPGSQVSVGSVAYVPLAILCLSDWAENLECLPAGKLAWLAGRGCIVVGLLPLVLLGCSTLRSALVFRSCEPVGLPGCRWLRMREEQAAICRWLVENVRSSDSYVCKFGFNSLYFWTNRRPAGYRTLVGWSWNGMPEEQQHEVIEECRTSGDLLAIQHAGVVGFIDNSPWDATVVGQFIRAEFRPVATAAGYTLLRLPRFEAKPLQGCAWYRPADQLRAPDGSLLSARPIELRVALPKEMCSLRVIRAVMVDLPNGDVLADTDAADPSRRAVLSEGREPLTEYRVVVQDGSGLVQAKFPLVRLIDDQGQQRTLVVAQITQGPGGAGPAAESKFRMSGQ
ncbi:MAG: hypothetical protein NTY19_08695 [Planctomycetota bacterium]|nr:hypothetical protein [Planctomycetota bacterium]